MNKLLLAVIALSLTACASSQQTKATSIATTPLSDLNVAKTDIPAVLVKARANAYAVPDDMQCLTLQAEVDLLDEALGPDLDVPVDEVHGHEKAEKVVGDAAMGAVQRTVEGAIPFRGWIRKLSGAERHSRKVGEAIAAGNVRRGFLKGMAVARACGRASV